MLMVVSPPTRDAVSGEERLKEYFTPLLLRLVRRAGEGGVGGGKEEELLLSEDDDGGGGGFMVWCVYCVGRGAAALAGSLIDECLSIDVGGALTASTAIYNYLLCSTSQSSTE